MRELVDMVKLNNMDYIRRDLVFHFSLINKENNELKEIAEVHTLKKR